MQATEVRAVLLPLLEGKGYYRLPSGQTVAAIAVLPDPEVGYSYPPAGTKIVGIECVIYLPLNGIAPILGGVMVPARWDLRLRAHDDSVKDLIPVANQITPELAKRLNCVMSNPSQIPANPSWGLLEQIVIRFSEYSLA